VELYLFPIVSTAWCLIKHKTDPFQHEDNFCYLVHCPVGEVVSRKNIILPLMNLMSSLHDDTAKYESDYRRGLYW
jgi:hypothetical protein